MGLKGILVIVIVGKTKYTSMKYSVCSVFIIHTLCLILSCTWRYVKGSRQLSVFHDAVLFYLYIESEKILKLEKRRHSM